MRKATVQLTAVLTNLPLRRSLSRLANVALASATEKSPRKTPSLKAFRTSKACNEVNARGALVRESQALAWAVFASTM